VLLLMACGKVENKEGEGSNTAPIVEVKIDSVHIGTIPKMVSATGMTRVLRQENISSHIEGKVVSLRVLEGDAVSQGQVIAVVETKESYSAIKGAELLVAQANSPEEKQRAERGLEQAKRNRTTVEVHAPFTGVVLTRALNEGEFVAPGGTIASEIDLRSLRFIAKLPAREISQVKVGQKATVSFQTWPEKQFHCQVENVKPQVDAVAQMAEVRLQFLSVTPELRNEMFGNVEIVVGQHTNALLLPAKGVLRDDETGIHTVVEAVGDSIGIIRKVEKGIETPTTIEVSGAGIRNGMHVIVEGHYGLPDSTRIRIIQ
jgi:multidrug efflux pump subunit AcrA (membrane-fusion protein)